MLVEAIGPTKMAPTSLSNKYKVLHNQHMLWMCIWMSSYHVTASLIGKALEDVSNHGSLPRGNQYRSVVVETIYPSKMAPISLSNTVGVSQASHNVDVHR